MVNVGLAGFGDDIVAAGGDCVALDWQPPAQGDRDAAWALADDLRTTRASSAPTRARSRASSTRSRCWSTSRPRATRCRAWPAAGASSCTPGRRSPGRRCAARCRARSSAPSCSKAGPIRSTPRRASSSAAAIDLEPCHHHGAVGPMAGIISPSMPLWVVENTARTATARTATSTKGSARCCASAPTGPRSSIACAGSRATSRRRCARRSRAPARIELMPLMAQALNMGDEVHNRNAAATALLFKRLAPALFDDRRCRATRPRRRSRSSPATTTSSSTCRWRRARRCSTRRRTCRAARWSTAMARNGVNFGVRLVGHRRRAGSRRRPIRSTASTSPATRSPMPRPTSAIRRSPRPPASAASRWPPRRRSSSSSAARRPTRRTTACACARSRSASIASFTLPVARLRAPRPPASTRARWSTAASCR